MRVLSHNKIFITVAMLVGLFLIAGCNIFEWSERDDPGSLIEEGNRLMRDAEYAAAADKFAQAKAKNPNDSEARYLHAKAVLHASGFNALFLGTVMTNTDFDGTHPFPFTGPEWPAAEANRLYQTVQIIREDLTPILNGQTSGPYDSADIDIDFAMGNAIEGTLLLRDTNLDGKVNQQDFQFEFLYTEGTGMTFANLPAYISTGLTASKSSPNGNAAADVDSLISVFNLLLDSAEVVINRSRDIIEQVLEDDIGLDPEEIDEVLETVIQMAGYFKINDPADNDGDGYVSEFGIGFDERINFEDDDGDGLIDEDSKYPWKPDDPGF